MSATPRQSSPQRAASPAPFRDVPKVARRATPPTIDLLQKLWTSLPENRTPGVPSFKVNAAISLQLRQRLHYTYKINNGRKEREVKSFSTLKESKDFAERVVIEKVDLGSSNILDTTDAPTEEWFGVDRTKSKEIRIIVHWTDCNLKMLNDLDAQLQHNKGKAITIENLPGCIWRGQTSQTKKGFKDGRILGVVQVKEIHIAVTLFDAIRTSSFTQPPILLPKHLRTRDEVARSLESNTGLMPDGRPLAFLRGEKIGIPYEDLQTGKVVEGPQEKSLLKTYLMGMKFFPSGKSNGQIAFMVKDWLPQMRTFEGIRVQWHTRVGLDSPWLTVHPRSSPGYNALPLHFEVRGLDHPRLLQAYQSNPSDWITFVAETTSILVPPESGQVGNRGPRTILIEIKDVYDIDVNELRDKLRKEVEELAKQAAELQRKAQLKKDQADKRRRPRL